MQVTLIDHCGSDLSVVNAARVSFDKESFWKEYEENNLFEKDEHLIYYLAKHKHLSPFNHCFLSFRIKAPIFVARQLVKHEYMPWNEVSRRYVDDEPEFYIPPDIRRKSEDKKQGSGKRMNNSSFWRQGMIDHTEASLDRYAHAKLDGMCPEQSRIFLPHNLMTEWIWSGTLGAFGKMLSLRLDSHTQEETREVAFMVRDEVEKLFPISLAALIGSYA